MIAPHFEVFWIRIRGSGSHRFRIRYQSKTSLSLRSSVFQAWIAGISKQNAFSLDNGKESENYHCTDYRIIDYKDISNIKKIIPVLFT